MDTLLTGFLEKGGPWAFAAALLGFLFYVIRGNDQSAIVQLQVQTQLIQSLIALVGRVEKCLSDHLMQEVQERETIHRVDDRTERMEAKLAVMHESLAALSRARGGRED